MDGTLCNVSSILHLLEEPELDFDRFHRDSVHCPANPMIIDAAVQAHAAGLKILIVTARLDTYRAETEQWLENNLSIPYDRIYMRGAEDFRPDGIVKREIFDMIIEDGYNVLHAWDDNPLVVEVWKSLGISVTVVESGYYGE